MRHGFNRDRIMRTGRRIRIMMDGVPPPPDTASFISQFFFLFISPVLRRGVTKGCLTQDDLPLLSRADNPGRILHDYLAGGQSAPGRAGAGGRPGPAKSPGVQLFRRILAQHWVRFLLAGLCLAFTNLSAVAVPIVLHDLLAFLDANDTGSGLGGAGTGAQDGPLASSQPWWYGYALALALTAACVGQALVIHQFWYQAAVICIHSEVLLTSLVYTKALSVSAKERARLHLTRGKLVNLMAVDACKLNETWVFPFLHWNTWSAAFTVTIAVWYLYSLMGEAGLLGAAVMLLFVPLGTFVSRASKRYNSDIQKRKDVRGNIISEAVAGFGTLKAYGWTQWFSSRIAEAREAEMYYARRRQYMGVAADFVGQLGPIAVMVVTFTTYGVFKPGVPLTAAIAFAAISWLEQLRQPIRSLPSTITTFADNAVSLDRLRRMLNACDCDVSSMIQWAPHSASTALTNEVESEGCGGQATVPMADWLSLDSLVREMDLGQLRRMEEGGKNNFGGIASGATHVIRTGDVDGVEEGEGLLVGLMRDDKEVKEERLCDAEMEEEAVDVEVSDGVAIVLKNVSFGWFEVEPLEEGKAGGKQVEAAPKHANEQGVVEGDPVFHPVLFDISFTCPQGSITLVLGPVGSGKSSLLSGLIGEADRLTDAQGTCRVAGRIAYAAQAAWVLNRTLRDNITFVSPYRPAWYDTVVRACALDVDAATWRQGHETIVGDAGITLSGGQKQRLALARALYADADVYILDDVLSAVDASVAAHIWSHAIIALLIARNKTVIMATHAVQYAPRPEVNQILVLSGQGRVAACGTYAALRLDPLCATVLGQRSTSHSQTRVHATVSASALLPVLVPAMDAQSDRATFMQSVLADANADTLVGLGNPPVDILVEDDGSVEGIGSVETQPGSVESKLVPNTGAHSGAVPSDDAGAETYAKGTVAAKAMWRFIHAMGPPPLLFTLIGLYVVTQGLVIASTWWMAVWVERGQSSTESMTYYASGYAILNAGVAAASLLRMFILAYGTLRAGTALHNGAIAAVLDSPASFFANNPAGRITNRFLADVTTVDTAVRYSISNFAVQLFTAVGILTVIAATTPYVLLWISALSYVYYKLAQRYRISARDMRRLQSVAKSPILSHFSESLRGAATIRAFGRRAATAFVKRHLEVSAVHVRAWLAYWAANEYISCWLEVMGCCIILATALMAVYQHGRGNLKTGDVGLTLTYNIQIPAMLMWLIRWFTMVETDAVSIERLAEYCDLEGEEAGSARRSQGALGKAEPVPVLEPPALQLDGVSMRYSEHPCAAPVLKGITLTLPRGCKMAIIGRTGAGKSSILQALLRMYPVDSGIMRVSGCDMTYPLSCSRARLHVTAMLQDGFLFSGSIRDNLLGPDAEEAAHAAGTASIVCNEGPVSSRGSRLDEMLLECLSAVGMHKRVQRWSAEVGGNANVADILEAAVKPVALDDTVSDAGANFSAGEKALLSLARALVRQRLFLEAGGERICSGCELIVCDEPTAQVDAGSDALVHDALLGQPAALLCIVHRLTHVHRFNLVAVVDEGVVVECGSPQDLQRDPNSAYSRLLASAVASGHVRQPECPA